MSAARALLCTLVLSGCARSCQVSPPGNGPDTGISDSGSTDTSPIDDSSSASTDDTSGDTTPQEPGTADELGCYSLDLDYAHDFTIEHVIVLVTDGVRITEFFGSGTSPLTGESTAAFTPELRKLWSEGAVVTQALAPGVTNTAEGHVELLTGYRIPQLNLANNDGPGFYRPELPTLFEAFADHFGALPQQIPLLANTHHLEGHAWSLHPDGLPHSTAYQVFRDTETKSTLSSDVLLTDEVWDWMQADEVHFLMANLHQMDRDGHTNGPADYTGEIKEVDERLVQMWEDIQSDPTYADSTLLVIVGDHGRHIWEDDANDWKEHGDQCSGCRQIPMFLLGPGIAPGAQIDAPYTLPDLAATIAWLADVELPRSSGMIIREALAKEPWQTGRCGEVSPAIAGDLQASVRYTGSPFAQKRVVVDGEILSSDAALLAEAPAVAQSIKGTQFACWRELSIETSSEYDDMPWQGQCRYRPSSTEPWQDAAFQPNIDGEDDYVSPWFAPSLAFDERGQLWAAFIDNRNLSSNDTHTLRVVRWNSSTGWLGLDGGFAQLNFPLFPDLAVYDNIAWVAYTSMEFTSNPLTQSNSRYTQHVELLRGTPTDASALQYARVFSTYNNNHGPTPTKADEDLRYGRSVQPAVYADDFGVSLAYIAYNGDVNSDGHLSLDELPTSDVYLVTSGNDGLTWSNPIAVSSNSVFGYLGLDFSPDGALDWAQRGQNGAIEVCRHYLGITSCQDTNATAIDSFSAQDTHTLASLRAEDGRLSLTPIFW